MTPLSVSLLIVYALCFAARMWSLRAAWKSPLFHGEGYFLDIQVAADFYREHGRDLLRRYQILVALPYAAELCGFLFLLAAGKLNHLPLLLLAGVTIGAVNTVAAGRIVRRQVRRFQVTEARPAVSGFISPLETRSLAGYTRPAVEAGLASGNVVSLVLLAIWYRASGAGFWPTFRLPCILLYAQGGFLLVKHATVAWRTAIPAGHGEVQLEFRERVRAWFVEISDWLRAHCVAFLMSYTAIVILGAAQNDMRVRWAVLAPWMALAIMMTVRMIGTSNRLRAYGVRLRPMRVPPPPARAAGLLYFNADDPAVVVRGALGYTLNLSNRRVQLYLAYALGLLAVVVAAAQR